MLPGAPWGVGGVEGCCQASALGDWMGSELQTATRQGGTGREAYRAPGAMQTDAGARLLVALPGLLFFGFIQVLTTLAHAIGNKSRCPVPAAVRCGRVSKFWTMEMTHATSRTVFPPALLFLHLTSPQAAATRKREQPR